MSEFPILDDTSESAPERSYRLFGVTPERALVWGFGVLLVALIAYLVVLLTVPDATEDSLGTYESPQHVTNDGREGGPPIVIQGSIVSLEGLRCINSKKTINVLNYRTFTRVDPPPPGSPVAVQATIRVREERADGGACRISPTQVAMPPGVEPGIWRIDGFDFSAKDGALRVWFSEDFEVVAPLAGGR